MTPAQVKRTAEYLSKVAQERIRTIEEIDGVMYVFGSELGCLRIFAHHNANGAVPNPKARIGYSANLVSWYFSLNLGVGVDSHPTPPAVG
jgi:hypothetical protein